MLLGEVQGVEGLKVSVIIPIYNVEAYIRACLESVFDSADQLRNELNVETEVLCIDDGSTDGSAAVLDELRTRADSLRHGYRILRQENRGVSAARNAGLDAASGDWIAFVDGDDVVAKGWLSELVRQTILHPGVQIVHARRLLIARNEKELQALLSSAMSSKVKVREFTAAAARNWGSVRFAADGWSVLNLVRREFIGSNRFRVGMRIKEDVVFFSELALRLDHAVETSAQGYFYRLRNGSALRQPRRVEDALAFCEAMRPFARGPMSRAIGYEVLQWAAERDWSQGYEGSSCPLRAFWKDGVATGRIDLGSIHWWWRLGLGVWMRTGRLDRLLSIREWRIRIGAAIVGAGRAVFGKRWTIESI